MMQKFLNPLQRKYLKVEDSIDYPMSNGKWTYRYETLDYVREELIKNGYTISESDEKKGVRLVIINKETGKEIWKMKQ